MTLITTAGRPIEAIGRAVGGRAVLRLRDVSGIERDLLDLTTRHERLNADVETMKALLESLPAPVWARDAAGHPIFANSAYARAVEAVDAGDAVARELELSTARPATTLSAHGPPVKHSPSACRPSSPANGASSTWSTRRAAAAAPASPSTVPKKPWNWRA